MGDYSHYLPYIFSVLTFVAVVLLVEGAYVWWNDVRGPEAKRVERRLRLMSAGANDADGGSVLKQRLIASSTGLQQRLLRIPRVRQLDRLLEQSGLTWTVTRFIGTTAAAALGAGLLASLLTRHPVLIALAAILAALLPIAFVLRARKRRLLRIELQLPDALDLMSRALRAGHAFPSSLKMVGDEMSDPIAAEFAATFEEVNFGVSLPEALIHLAARVPSQELKYFVVAVLIQRTTGGNLSELLDQIAAIMRARQKLLGTIRVLSADGRLSAWVLCILPFALAAVIFLVNPKFLSVLWTDPAGIAALMVAGLLMLVGIFWMRQVIRIHL